MDTRKSVAPKLTSRRDFASSATMSALGMLLASQVRSAAPAEHTDQEFDYIVVGAGSTGCVVANRLSKDKDVSVLLLEAGGPDDDPRMRKFPADFSELLGTRFDWKYQTSPDKNLNGRRIAWPRGKTFGGTSSIHGMVFIRGNRRDFDHWSDLANSGWSYDELLPLFKKSEANSRFNDEFHGANGPMSVESALVDSDLKRAMSESLGAEGFEVDADWDFNGEMQAGTVGYYQFTIKNGERHSAASGFLTPVLSRSNLTARPWSLATRLVWENDRAAGIQYVTNSWDVQTARARREVIICAGAIDTPQLLMLSGLGPADELEKHHIPVRFDLPGVGQNLQDHLCVSIVFEPTGQVPGEVHGTGGLFSYSSRCEARESPDLQYYWADFFTKKPVGNFPRSGFWTAVSLGSPDSRGSITLRSANPLESPILQANYLSSPRDLPRLVEGFSFLRKLVSRPSFNGLIAQELTPGKQFSPETAIRREGTTIYHPVGTCKMGNDPLSVVDSQLRVHGVSGLRIADASIMPKIINGNTHAPCVMIGEKAAAMIQADQS